MTKALPGDSQRDECFANSRPRRPDGSSAWSSTGVDGTRRHSIRRIGSETPRTSRRLCGPLAFVARIRPARSTAASLLMRKVRCRHGRSSKQGASEHHTHDTHKVPGGDNARRGRSSVATLTIAPCWGIGEGWCKPNQTRKPASPGSRARAQLGRDRRELREVLPISLGSCRC